MVGLKGTGDLEDDEKEVSLQDVMLSLLNSKDLEFKTEINNPKDLAVLKTFGTVLKMESFPQSSKLINDFLNTYLKYMVSFQRKSRTEMVKAIVAILDRETKQKSSMSERLTTNLRK